MSMKSGSRDSGGGGRAPILSIEDALAVHAPVHVGSGGIRGSLVSDMSHRQALLGRAMKLTQQGSG